MDKRPVNMGSKKGLTSSTPLAKNGVKAFGKAFEPPLLPIPDGLDPIGVKIKMPKLEWICEAIVAIGEPKKGASFTAIKAWILSNKENVNENRIVTMLKKAVIRGLEAEVLSRPNHSKLCHGVNGSFMLHKHATKTGLSKGAVKMAAAKKKSKDSSASDGADIKPKVVKKLYSADKKDIPKKPAKTNVKKRAEKEMAAANDEEQSEDTDAGNSAAPQEKPKRLRKTKPKLKKAVTEAKNKDNGPISMDDLSDNKTTRPKAKNKKKMAAAKTEERSDDSEAGNIVSPQEKRTRVRKNKLESKAVHEAKNKDNGPISMNLSEEEITSYSKTEKKMAAAKPEDKSEDSEVGNSTSPQEKPTRILKNKLKSKAVPEDKNKERDPVSMDDLSEFEIRSHSKTENKKKMAATKDEDSEAGNSASHPEKPVRIRKNKLKSKEAVPEAKNKDQVPVLKETNAKASGKGAKSKIPHGDSESEAKALQVKASRTRKLQAPRAKLVANMSRKDLSDTELDVKRNLHKSFKSYSSDTEIEVGKREENGRAKRKALRPQM